MPDLGAVGASLPWSVHGHPTLWVTVNSGSVGGCALYRGHLPFQVLDAGAKETEECQWARAGLQPALSRPPPPGCTIIEGDPLAALRW